MVTLEQIRDAHRAILGRIHRTPLLSSNTLGKRTGAHAFLKAECLQRTGSFKVRGALNRIRRLSAEEKERGLVAVSAGNHAQAVAFAASAAGARSTVVMPEGAPHSKAEASGRYGATVILHGNVFDAWERALELQRQHGYIFIHPYDDLDIIAGQGTVGLEILDDAADPDVVVVPIGGGGLIAGVATAIKSVRPATRVIGVEPVGAACVWEALRADKVVQLERVETIADGLAAPYTAELPLAHIRKYVDDVVRVTDEQIVAALLFVLERAKLMLEPAGAAAVAALLTGQVRLRPTQKVVAVLSGGNIDLSRLRTMLPDAAAEPAKFGALKG
ncbi:MAG: threonine ammonia-lyase [Longimicrobiales bacterium]